MEKRRKNRIILKHRYRDSRFRRKKTGSSHVTFSALGVFFPLICALINHMNTLECLCLPIISLALFGICTLSTFIYLALLLRWKNVDMEGVRHESDS